MRGGLCGSNMGGVKWPIGCCCRVMGVFSVNDPVIFSNESEFLRVFITAKLLGSFSGKTPITLVMMVFSVCKGCFSINF